MTRYYKFFEYAYLIIAIVFTVETVLNWVDNREKAYIFMAFAALAVFMYFFRKKYRKKFEDRDK
jgi:positive regulator of sigma E activity